MGSSHNRHTSAEDYEEALLSGYPPVDLLDAKNVYHARREKMGVAGGVARMYHARQFPRYREQLFLRGIQKGEKP